MNRHQLKWAMKHDWFVTYITAPSNDEICIVVRDDLTMHGTLEFWDYLELRNWAGY